MSDDWKPVGEELQKWMLSMGVPQDDPVALKWAICGFASGTFHGIVRGASRVGNNQKSRMLDDSEECVDILKANGDITNSATSKPTLVLEAIREALYTKNQRN